MALPEQLSYTQQIDALGLPKDRIGLSPNNGADFNCDGAIIFEIPCRQTTKYADFSNCYISFDLKNEDTAIVELPFQIGTIALQNKLTIETTSNKKFCEVDNVNTLMDLKLSQSVDQNWYNSNGNKMFGTGFSTGTSSAVSNGVTIPVYDGASSATILDTMPRYIMPIDASAVCDGQYFPLAGRENIRFRIDLEAAQTAFIAADNGLTNANITLSNVMLNYDVMTLEDEMAKSLLAAMKFKYLITGNDYYHQNEQIAQGLSGVNIQLGCSRRRAKKVYGILRNVDDLTGVSGAVVNSFGRNKAGITQVTVKYNGKKVNQNDLIISNTSAEAFAESMKSSHGSLMSLHTVANGNYETFGVVTTNAATPVVNTTTVVTYNKTDVFNIAESDNTLPINTGRWYFEIDLENGLQKDGTSVSGLNVSSGNFTLEMTKAASTQDQRLDLFVEYASEYVLDMEAGGSWTIMN